MSEFAKADKMVERFLGIRSGHLCPQFNFNHNTQPMLIFEVITSSLILQAIFFGARWMNSKLHPEDTEKENVDGSLQDLDQFSTMVDKTLTSMTQLQTQALSTQQTNRSAMDSYRQERPRDLQRLRDEFQEKISAVKNKWQNEPEEPGAVDETTDFHVTAALAVLYWALQAILSCTVLCCIGVSMISIADGGVWPHYCLLMYAVSNCGMLPTACQALVFLADWFFFEAIVSAPARAGATQPQPSNPSYQPLEQMTSPRRSEAARRRQEEVNDMKPKFAILCMPELVALGFMAITHTIPFMFMFLWMTLLILVVGYLVVRLVQRFVKSMWPDPRRRALHQMQIFALLFYMFLSLYVHASVQVMTRVYAGEWRHGGYFDSLWWHLIIDTADLSSCPWFTFVRVVDFPLRWT